MRPLSSRLLPLLMLLSGTVPLISSEPPAESPPATATVANQAEANAADLYRKAGNDLRPLSPEENSVVTNALRNSATESAAFPESAVSSLLAAYSSPLKLVAEAASLPRCDWGHDYSKGLSISYAHTQPLITFTRLLCVQLRLQVKRGSFTEALVTARQIVNIRRHVASEQPLAIEVLIQSSLNHLLRRAFANDLQAWPQSSLPALEQLFAPPSTASFVKAIQTETAIARTHFEQTILPSLLKAPGSDPGKAKSIITAYQADSRKIEALLQLPAAEALRQAEALRESFKRNEAQSPLTPLGLDSIVGLVGIDIKNNIYNALFQTAIDVRLHGTKAIANSRDPFGGKPFTYQEDDHDFTLTSAFIDKEKALSLTIR